jgi:TRAP-type uncharacterized transport system substrate-binding protein
MAIVPAVAHAADDPTKFRYCSGIEGGNYEFTAIAIERQLPGHISNVHTKGSMDNMEAVAKGDCQGGIVQSDAYFVYMQQNPSAQMNVERARDMYPEYGHLICNKTISEISDLTNKNTVLVGPPGSGSSVMWDAIVRANPTKYKDVQTLPLGGARALGKVSDGIDAQCMLFVAGLKAQVMLDANEAAKTSNGNLHLTYMRDPALFKLQDSRGRPIYTRSEIPSGTYPYGLQSSGWFTSGSSVDTVQVESILIDNVPYADAHGSNVDKVLRAVDKAMPQIKQHMTH